MSESFDGFENVRPETQVEPGLTTQILKELVEFPTPTSGRDKEFALAYAARELQAAGLHIQQFEPTEKRHAALIASSRLDNSMAPKVMLAAHIDTTPLPCAPHDLSVREENGRLYGHGILDMKVAVAAYLVTAAAFKNQQADLDYAIMLTSDEEYGHNDGPNGVREFVAEGCRPEMVILPDGSENWQLEAAARGVLWYTFEAAGTGGHASRSWESHRVNPILRINELINDLSVHFNDQGPNNDSWNPSIISGGDATNQIPTAASLKIDIRVCDAESMDYHKARIDELSKKHELSSTLHMDVQPAQTDLTHPLVESFASIIHEKVGVSAGDGFQSYGASDARFFGAAGIPYAVFYPYGGGHHGGNEWVDARSVELMPDVIATYLERFAH